jgi:ribokinase
VIVVSHDGENSIVVTPAANQKLTPHDLETHLQMIREAGLVLTQLETPLETVECLAQICARERVPLILDPAPARDFLPPSSSFSTGSLRTRWKQHSLPKGPRLRRTWLQSRKRC